MSVAVTHVLRQRPVLKTVSALVLVAFLSLSLQPLAVAAQALQSKPVPKVPANTPGDGAALARTLDTVQTRLNGLERKIGRGERHGEELLELRTLRRDLTDEDRATLASFERIGQQLKAKRLPPVILDRHAQAVKTYQAEFARTLQHLDGIDSATDYATRQARTRAAMQFLAEKQSKKARQKFDPNDLPTAPLAPNMQNTPKLNRTQFQKAGLAPNPSLRLAALGDFKFDQLPGASDPAYLAATAEVVLTSAIQAKAQELNHDPVKIHHWIRNNVEWLPTWGATQDAEVTLGSQRGNSMDIASLEIALLRASGIPARYVYGTIEVPADQYRNWAGGFSDINAAMDYASAGGIPVTGISSAGKITRVRIEHVWVEAAIDFHPSRGAVNKSADRWVELDASYKQYQDLPGLDVVQIAGLDPTALAQSFATSGTVNDAEGWVQNLNPAILTSAQTQAQTALQTYIQNNLTNPTVGDVIGGRKIIVANHTVLPTALPYRTIVTGARYGNLPTGLQNTMTFSFGVDVLGEPSNPISFPWAKLNNHKVTLSFKPASAADEQALASLLPSGPITDPSQLPSSIPAYLIHVIPELAVDGQTVLQGSSMTLGADLNFFYGIHRLNPGQSQTYSYLVTAGSYLSVAVAGGSVSPGKQQVLFSKLGQTLAALNSGDATSIGNLSRDDVLGDVFYAAAVSYFSHYISLADAMSLPNSSRHNLPMGYGTFGYETGVHSLFGIPLAITAGAFVINVRPGFIVQPVNGDQVKRLDQSLQMGMLSSILESAIPDKIFSTSKKDIQSVSAVKALQLAANSGQRIYHITTANKSQALSNLHLSALAMDEITRGLDAGKEVITHTDRISVPGWTGEGYIIYDPVTGSGAYKVTGGANGVFSSWCGIQELGIQSIVVAILLVTLMAIILSGIPALVATAVTTAEIMTQVAAFIASSLVGLPAVIRATAGAAMLVIVSEQVAAGNVIGEICESQNSKPAGPINGKECVYQCSDGFIFERPSKVHTVCGGGQERYCPARAARP